MVVVMASIVVEVMVMGLALIIVVVVLVECRYCNAGIAIPRGV